MLIFLVCLDAQASFFLLSAASLFQASWKKGDYLTHPHKWEADKQTVIPLKVLGHTKFIRNCHPEGGGREPSVMEEQNQTWNCRLISNLILKASTFYKPLSQH